MAKDGDRLWGGGYNEDTHPLVQRMNASVWFDRAMAREDIIGSVAHATMLNETGLLDTGDYELIVHGLRVIHTDIEFGRFEWVEAREDVHMNIEAALRDRIGDAAGRLHTARSRNDQVALDERLWLRRVAVDLAIHLLAFIEQLAQQARAHADWPMCGYTHLQRAQPITVGHYLLAHSEALERDLGRLLDTLARMDVCPLGAGALAGTTLPIDRDRTAELLGFGRVARNSLDAVSDRDHLLEMMAAAALGMSHLSRMGEELCLYASAEFGYVRISDAFTTGSSLMPQKKNPDMAELVRGKSGRVVGNLVSLLVTLKGLPLAYNKDLQEDKEPLFDTMRTWDDCLVVMTDMLGAVRWQKQALLTALDEGFLLATDLADLLVAEGVPFRKAHAQVASLVAELVESGHSFETWGFDKIARRFGLEAGDVGNALNVRNALRKRDVDGAPHPIRVKREARGVHKRAEAWRRRIDVYAQPTEAESILHGA